MSNNSIWPMDRTLSGTTIQSQRRLGSDGHQGYSAFPKIPVCLMPYQVTPKGWGSYPFAEMKLLYSIAPTDNASSKRLSWSVRPPPTCVLNRILNTVMVMLELWVMQSTPSLLYLSIPPWLGVVAPEMSYLWVK